MQGTLPFGAGNGKVRRGAGKGRMPPEWITAP
jgi:hypothetical protein